MRRRTRLLAFCVWGVLYFIVFAGWGQAQEKQPETRHPELLADSLEGKFEIDVHYSNWSLELFRSWFEEQLYETLAKKIRNEVSPLVIDSHPLIYSTDEFEHDFSFDSSGYNVGLEFRYYPKGKGSSFSLGFSIELNKMKVLVLGSLKQEFSNKTYTEGDTEAHIIVRPLLTNLSFRWDLIPKWTVSPYFIIGLGVGTMKGEIMYKYQSVYTWSGPSEEYTVDVEKTLMEAEEDSIDNLPNIFPLFQLSFGLRAQILPLLHLKGEAGFWNGFILRAGAAFRF